MKKLGWIVVFFALACGGSSGPTGEYPNVDCDDFAGQRCVQVGTPEELLEETALLDEPTVVVLASGTFALAQSVTIRADGVSLVGQGIDTSTLAFTGGTTQFNGVDVVGDDFLVQDLTVLDAPKDGIRVENSDGVTFRRIRTTWTNEDDPMNGSYGIYPVKSRNVLVEDSFAENASDAGLYVGQCQNVIVRRNTVRGNVAGLEIENTQYADVYENLAEDNTGGIVVFDLPGNPIVGRDVRLRNNVIRNNNNPNFAPSGTVGILPAGTGTFAMASRRVEITDNTYENNQTGDIAVISGLIADSDPAVWSLEVARLVGDHDDLGLLPGAGPNTVANYRSENIVIARNTHSGSGENPDISRDMGFLLALLYGDDPTDSVLYDGIGESMFDAEVPANNSNDNHVCAGGNTAGTFGNLNAIAQLETPGSPHFSLTEPPFAPYDCTTLEGGPVAEVVLP